MRGAKKGRWDSMRFYRLGHMKHGKEKQGFRRIGPSFRYWYEMKDWLDKLIIYQRIEGPLNRMKEVQQYAEEIVFHARRNTPYSTQIVESMLRSAEARQILYEYLVPRYKDRPYFVTRMLNPFYLRYYDAQQRGYLEFIDWPGEFRAANPVGEGRKKRVAIEFDASRKGRRKHLVEARVLGIVNEADPRFLTAEAYDKYVRTAREGEHTALEATQGEDE
ncbi:ribosomal protein L17, putative [Perkinsus marinus ATCC 50983]|uniref:Ribosomal protein L17, putative n=1 Tax=Perkinsus marinus (strain ATCC 50983 / TXsc) TaxID=423536 RepID=C5KJC6_PERM5|nr:ribosomal protein L17, putative [Perkinsus marinus ATCC 50983]EER15428.1 ribosomal protein L17, putative [Perkinsus marinus ATCC 50983]|eukprot:XP_002783632.1 ribosomal protein L17, putative [Perkinsus marinus ATCC 50983]